MANKQAPRVFLSHATDDKERFVIRFAEKLCAKGIDVWFDKWEIFPGDSLVEKIFEEGLKETHALIVVLSRQSVNKPWVREELNAGIVKRIESRTRIIPVVIEDCDIPEALKSTVWVRIRDMTSYDVELEQIVNVLYGIREKPTLGSPPRHVLAETVRLSGLAAIDSLVFRSICDYALTADCSYVDTAALPGQMAEADISKIQLQESLQILSDHSYISVRPSIGEIFLFEITTYGLEQYANQYIANYSQLVRIVATKILNDEVRSAMELTTSLSMPRIVIDHILTLFESRGYLKAIKAIGNTIWVNLSPRFRRDFSAY